MDRQFNWTCPETYQMTAAKIRLETYIGLAHGIRGFMYWPGSALVDHRLAEVGIVCLEVEPLTELIVEAEKVPGGATTDNEQVEVQRLDWGDYDVIILLTNAIKYDEAGELKTNAEKLKSFVHDGGRIVLFQQNGWDKWDDSILPYNMELLTSGRRYEPPVVTEPNLLGDFALTEIAGEERTVGFYAIKLDGATSEEWQVLAYSGESENEALAAACQYGEGRVIVNQFAILDRIGEPVMRSMMVETVRYVLSNN